MPIALMRFLDLWIGVPLCRVLGLLCRMHSCRPAVSLPGALRTILIVKLSETGSLILAHSLIAALRRCFPEARLLLVTFDENAEAASEMGYVSKDSLFVIRRSNCLVLLSDLLRACFRLRRLHPDAAIDLEFSCYATAVISSLSGAPLRAGFSLQQKTARFREILYTHCLPYRPGTHVSLQFRGFADLLKDGYPPKHCGFEPLPRPPEFIAAPGDFERMEKSLAASGRLLGQPVLLIHAGDCTLPLRDWPAGHFIACVRSCLQKLDCFVVLVGGAKGAKKAEKICHEINDRRCVSFVGLTSFKELLALCSIARCLLAADGGLAHIASLTPVRKVVFFGPESPELFSPLPRERTHILYRSLSCSPCFSAYNRRTSSCRDNRCLRQICPEEVLICVKESMVVG